MAKKTPKTPKTIVLVPRNGKTPHTRKLDPATASIEIGCIVCKDKNGHVLQTISLERYKEGIDLVSLAQNTTSLLATQGV